MTTKEAMEETGQVVPSTPRRVVHVHRVLLYTTCYNVIDGVTLTIRKIEQALLAAGHQVLILTTRSGDMKNTHLVGVHPNRQVVFLDNSIPIPFLEDPNNPTLQYHIGFSLSRSTRALLDEFEPSVIHITVPDCTCLHLVQYARDKEIPLMGTYHSNIPDYMYHYPGLSWLKPILGTFFLHQYGFLQHLYVPTPYIHKLLSEDYKMDKATSLEIWGRGIDLERFSPLHRSLEFRRSLGVKDEDVVICWVGRLVPEKRTDVFASVVRRLHAQGIRFHTLIVGRGASEEDVKTLPNSTFCGWLDGQQLAIAYASSDIFLFPSSVETFGNVTLEAAASGLALVVEAGCSGHLINDGENGFACTTEEDFYEATLNLIVDRPLRERCCQASRQFSLLFENSAVVNKMLDNYTTVTEEFYCDYGGHHENRDRLYLERDYAFSAGSHPRPTALVLVELLFVTAFRVMTWLWLGFVCLIHKTIAPPHAATVAARTPPPSPTRTTTTTTSPVKKKRIHRIDTLTLLEEGGVDSDDDDATSTTASLSDASTSSTTDSSVSIGDGPCCVGLATGFIKFVAFQCRMESKLRRGVSSTKSWSPSRRRKDSSVTSPARLLRDRSDDSDCSEDSRYQEDTLKRRCRRSPPPPLSNGSSFTDVLLDTP